MKNKINNLILGIVFIGFGIYDFSNPFIPTWFGGIMLGVGILFILMVLPRKSLSDKKWK